MLSAPLDEPQSTRRRKFGSTASLDECTGSIPVVASYETPDPGRLTSKLPASVTRLLRSGGPHIHTHVGLPNGVPVTHA
jgi:hypothetical protein